MATFWHAYVNLWNWQTGIPIAFIAATAIAFMVYADDEEVWPSIGWGLLAFAIAYGVVWLLIGSRANVAARWWLDESRNDVAWGLALIIGVITGIVVFIISVSSGESDPGSAGFGVGCVTWIVLGLIFMALFAAGNYVFIGAHYLLYGAALIAFPVLPCIALYFILTECLAPGVPLTLFGCLTFSGCVGLVHLLSLNLRFYLSPLPFLSAPFVVMAPVLAHRRTPGAWVGGICCLFIITLIQLTGGVFPLFDEIQGAARTLNLTWVLVTYLVVGSGLGAYYLWSLFQKGSDEEVENLHPLWAIGAVVLNVVLTYPLVLNYDRLSWVFIFVGVSTLIGIVLIFGRWWVLSR